MRVCDFHYAGAPFEIRLATAAVDRARAIASEKLLAQATLFEAEFVIGSGHQGRHPRGAVRVGLGCELNDLDVEISCLGTGVRKIPGARDREKVMPPFMLSMIPLGRRRDVAIGGEGDDDDIRVAAEEAEEAALETDEANAPDEVDDDDAGGD